MPGKHLLHGICLIFGFVQFAVVAGEHEMGEFCPDASVPPPLFVDTQQPKHRATWEFQSGESCWVKSVATANYELDQFIKWTMVGQDAEGGQFWIGDSVKHGALIVAPVAHLEGVLSAVDGYFVSSLPTKDLEQICQYNLEVNFEGTSKVVQMALPSIGFGQKDSSKKSPHINFELLKAMNFKEVIPHRTGSDSRYWSATGDADNQWRWSFTPGEDHPVKRHTLWGYLGKIRCVGRL